MQSKHKEDASMSELHGYALAVLVAHIKDMYDVNSGPSLVFKLTDLAKFYSETMKEMGVDHSPHTTRLKDRLLVACPHLQTTGGAGQDILFTFRKDYDEFVRSSPRDCQMNAFQFSEVATSIRTDIFESENVGWEGSVDDQSRSTPVSLRMLIKMLLRGPGNISSGSDEQESFDQTVNTLAQLVCFHRTKKLPAKEPTRRRHLKQREKPVPVFLAMKLYGEARSKELIEITHKLGISISYDRIQAILDGMALKASNRFSAIDVVCPASLLKGEFVVGAADNLDHDTSAYTAKNSFHGTAISLSQFPDGEVAGLPQAEVASDYQETKISLPPRFAIVKPYFENAQAKLITAMVPSSLDLPNEPYLEREEEWLNSNRGPDSIPWAAFHARKQGSGEKKPLTRSAVLPLFTEAAHSLSMMVHCIQVVRSATEYLNPEQTPVLVVDQPLYALCKLAQFMNITPEKETFIMMGGLHLEMASLRALGKLLENSGWVEAVVQADITTQGRAESMLKGTHVTRTRYAHQVTAAVLYDLMRTAYEEQEPDETLSFELWRAQKSDQIPQFKYWDLVLKLELTLLQLVRSFRTADFEAYKISLRQIVGWFFALDQTNYARWVSVHIRDLVNITKTHPGVAENFEAGKFVARKTERPFSTIALDQNHEQINACLKGSGGMIGLTEAPDQLLKWLLASPDLASTVEKFEISAFGAAEGVDVHHSDKKSFLGRFGRDVTSLKKTFQELGNPFVEDGSELYNIATKVVPHEKAPNIVQTIENIGDSQYRAFVEERLETSKKRVTDPIPQNRLSIWTSGSRSSAKTKDAAKIQGLQSDCALFSRLYIACQSRGSDLGEFFRYENQPAPPSLSHLGQLRSCTKSDIIGCLVDITEAALSYHASVPSFDAKVFDGAALVHMLAPASSTTFQDYVAGVFLPFMKSQCSGTVKRVDVVWDTYQANSLKAATREKRGHGDRIVVSPATKIPKKSWASFLRHDENKKELFRLLAHALESLQVEGVEFYSNVEETVVTSSEVDVSGISPSNHEEADTRILLHVSDAAKKGHKNCLIRTSDSDVLVLAVALSEVITGLEQLWVSIGTGQHHRLIAANSISKVLGPLKCRALPIFHAFTGCDVVSSFARKGKKTAFEAWDACDGATEGFLAIGRGDIQEGLPLIEQYVVAMYDRTSSVSSVDECRRSLFTRKGRVIEAIPPTQDALRLHCLRAGFQGGQVWGQCLKANQDLPDPALWGWKRSSTNSGFWEPKWTVLPAMQESLVVLIKCACKQPCGSRCKCIRSNLPCTELCQCGGDCERQL